MSSIRLLDIEIIGLGHSSNNEIPVFSVRSWPSGHRQLSLLRQPRRRPTPTSCRSEASSAISFATSSASAVSRIPKPKISSTPSITSLPTPRQATSIRRSMLYSQMTIPNGVTRSIHHTHPSKLYDSLLFNQRRRGNDYTNFSSSSDCCSKSHLARPTNLHIQGGIHFRIGLAAAADPEDARHLPRLQPHQLALGLGPRGRQRCRRGQGHQQLLHQQTGPDRDHLCRVQQRRLALQLGPARVSGRFQKKKKKRDDDLIPYVTNAFRI